MRLPVILAETYGDALTACHGQFGNDQIERAILEMAAAINDADFYCSEYAGKEQPHLDNLYTSLANGLAALLRQLDSMDPAECTPAYRAKRILH